MGKKTMVSIKGKGYTMTEGYIASLTSGARRTITFNKKIIAMLFRYTDSSGYVGHPFYINPSIKFWKNSGLTVLDEIAINGYRAYVYNTAKVFHITQVSDYSVELYNQAGTMPHVYYIAILEDAEVVSDPIFLLNNTVLYTDGTPTTDVEGAIQTVESNKYKIKADALVTITGATYVNLSN